MNKQIKIVAIGDSITYGYPYGPAASWFAMAAKTLDFAGYNEGVNGDTTAGMRRRFQRQVIARQPEYVIIMGGTNDVYGGTGIDQIAGNIIAMAEMAVKSGIVPIIGLPVPCNDSYEDGQLAKARERMRQQALQQGMAVIDFCQPLAAAGGGIQAGLACDDVHPSQAGYKVMGSTAIKCLEGILVRPVVNRTT